MTWIHGIIYTYHESERYHGCHRDTPLNMTGGIPIMSTVDSTTHFYKTCTRCGATYPATFEYWYRQKSGKYGYESICRKCRKIKSDIWRVSNPEKIARYQKNWKIRNPEKANLNKREWENKNPAKVAVQRKSAHLRRKARLKSLPDTVTGEDIQSAYNYFNNCCAVCGNQMNGLFTDPHLDHWIPLTNPNCPGSTPDNMIPLCSTCNRNKWDKDPIAWLKEKYRARKATRIAKRINDYLQHVKGSHK